MFSTKGLQFAIAAALLTAVSAPAFAAQTPDCMRKIGICDRGEDHKQEHAISVGGESPAGGEQPEGDPTGGETTDTSPQVE
jgi:hypothetical protein